MLLFEDYFWKFFSDFPKRVFYVRNFDNQTKKAIFQTNPIKSSSTKDESLPHFP